LLVKPTAPVSTAIIFSNAQQA